MKIKIVSDLHIDYNKTIDFGFIDEINKVDLTLIAGDISGDYKYGQVFLDELLDKAEKPVIAVAGNHLGYNYLFSKDTVNNILDGTKDFSIRYLTDKYNSGNIRYLQNGVVCINNKLIYAGTMYTDFNLYGQAEEHSQCGERGLNDFRYVYNFDPKLDKVAPIRSEYYIEEFNKFIMGLKNIIEETQDSNQDIIVLTHFAPSIKSISSKYQSSYYLNPSYASNLENLIIDNPRIKLWVHGHMHDSFDYKVGNCRVVCNPYGYYPESHILPDKYKGKNVRVK